MLLAACCRLVIDNESLDDDESAAHHAQQPTPQAAPSAVPLPKTATTQHLTNSGAEVSSPSDAVAPVTDAMEQHPSFTAGHTRRQPQDTLQTPAEGLSRRAGDDVQGHAEALEAWDGARDDQRLGSGNGSVLSWGSRRVRSSGGRVRPARWTRLQGGCCIYPLAFSIYTLTYTLNPL